LFEYSEELARDIPKDIKTTQIRKYFDEVKKISEDEEKFKYEIRRFLALVLYNIYRKMTKNNEKKLKEFSSSMKNMVEVVTEGDLNYLRRFKDFFEAVVAYYKYYNPGKN